MTTILAVLGTFIVTSAGNVWMARYYIRQGFQLGRDDRVLDPGETTGQLPHPTPEETTGPIPVVGRLEGHLPAVEESPGKHRRKRARPAPAGDPDATVVLRDEVRA